MVKSIDLQKGYLFYIEQVKLYTFKSVNNKDADQIAWMHRLIGIFGF